MVGRLARLSIKRKAAAEAGEDNDHDFRALKYPDRLRMVQKNKDEGTELFKGGNYRPACARYTKAMSHAAKFRDCSPEQKAEVDALKLSLYLNLAQCYIKLEAWDNARKNCDEAILLDSSSSKAYYRMAYCKVATKDYVGAVADLKRCASMCPESEAKACEKLLATAERGVKADKLKQKKMAAKMFG